MKKGAKAMVEVLLERGYNIVSGGTYNHLFLIDLVSKGLTGKEADAALGRANITVNKNSVPNDPKSPFVTFKTLAGPRGGLILAQGGDEDLYKKLNSAVFPGGQGGPLMHVIAGKAVAFKEAMEPEFKTYQQQVAKMQTHKPKMIIGGFSAYSGVCDWAKMREIADSIGAWLFVDMAHVAGLVAADVYPNPVPHAHIVTTTTRSGSQANFAVYTALLQPGDTILGMNLAHGGHLTHGSPVNLSGKLYNVIPYGIDETGKINYDELAELVQILPTFSLS
ncbi:hypothetical protein CRX72_25310 [Pantoea sp. BRM17]|nr:hypothetical protein CRX72_25310 [Pantoea sp. BRM17]